MQRAKGTAGSAPALTVPSEPPFPNSTQAARRGVVKTGDGGPQGQPRARLRGAERGVGARDDVVLLVGLAVDLAALFLSGAISRVPGVGGLNRVGGLLAGAALAVLVIWLLTTCLLLLPPTLLPFTSGVRRSETAQLVRRRAHDVEPSSSH